VGVAEILVLSIDTNVGEGIGAGAGHPHRHHLRGEPKGADFPGMIAKIRLERDPPVWCNAADRALPRRVDPEGELRIGRQRTVAAEFEVEQIVEERISAEADDLLRVDLVDERGGGGHRR